MKTTIKRAGSLVTALCWTLVAGMPAVADDVELFSAPAPVKPSRRAIVSP